jgi:hypothetical protein
MKLLKIELNSGHYLNDAGGYSAVDKLSKEDLLRLVNLTLEEGSIEFDDYDESLLKNQAHQVIYKSVVQKLKALRERRQEFLDESERLFLPEYEKYRSTEPK